MKAKFLVISCGILALASACNNSSDSKAKETDTANAMSTDTAAAMPKDTAVVAAPAPAIDSAAVTREFLAAQKKTKKTPPPKPKKQGTNEVEVYNEAPIPSHEALEQPAPVATKTTPAPEKVVHTKEYVYFAPSTNASFPGGVAALGAYIKKTMVYPDKALQFHVEGTVYAEVTIDSLGYVKKVEFPATHLGFGLEEETEFVLKSSPRWIPAKENGNPVTSKITVPVVYKITH
jgi:protein TonB